MFADVKKILLGNVRSRVCDYVRARHARIDVIPEQGIFNQRCFFNAAEYQRRHPGTEVHEVIYIDYDEPFLHYVNFDPVDGKYLETTLGFRAEHLEYYHVRKIANSEIRDIHNVFSLGLRSWDSQFLRWYHRLFGIDRIV